MTKRGSPTVQVIIVIAVVGVFLYGFYRYHDQHTLLKRSEESADKLKQKTESLSAQLQVLYEHKTRLENAVSQEKDIAKKTKEELDVQKTELERKVDQQKNENAELVQQVENLQKKLEAGEEDATKASQAYKQLQQENENAVSKLRDELADVKRRLDGCHRKTNVVADNMQQNVDRGDSRINQVPRADGESNDLHPDEGEDVQQQYKDMQQQLQDNMQVAAPNVANNQSLAVQEDLESQHQRPIPADDDDDDDDDIDRQQSKKLADAAKDEDYKDDIERPQHL